MIFIDGWLEWGKRQSAPPNPVREGASGKSLLPLDGGRMGNPTPGLTLKGRNYLSFCWIRRLLEGESGRAALRGRVAQNLNPSSTLICLPELLVIRNWLSG